MRFTQGSLVLLAGFYGYTWTCDRLLVYYRESRIDQLQRHLAHLEGENAQLERRLKERMN